ncbi:MAG: histidine--tRNA ligase [Anaerolineae bacterium]
MYRAPRGTQDILPQDQPYWQFIRDQIHRLSTLYGYERLDLPLFEETPLFTRGIGAGTDIVEREMYTFEDKGGDSLTLLPEATASVMRGYLEHGMYVLPQPVKLYSILPIFRYERPQAGRFRQHYQFNCEAIGVQDPALDAEVISLAWRFYKELGLRGLDLQLNSIGDRNCRPAYTEALIDYYLGKEGEICADCRVRLKRNPLRLLDCRNEGCQPIIEAAPKSLDFLSPECAEHFATLQEQLNFLQIPYQLNHRLVRGLDYYTKTVFEVWAPGIGAQNALCGGGRYDGLAKEIGGRDTPAIGFAIGLERVIMTMKAQGVQVPPWPGPQIFLAYHGSEAKEEGLRLVDRLREAGFRAIMSFGDRSLKAQMREADREGVEYTLILGEEERRRGEITAREMATGQEAQVEMSRLEEWLRERLEDK